MKTLHTLLTCATCGSGILLTGCQNVIEPSKTTTAFYKDQVHATVQVSESVNTVAKALAPDSPAVKARIDAIAAENEALKQEISKARKEADEKNEELKRKVVTVAADAGDALLKAGNIASAFSGAGPLVGSLIDRVGGVVTEKLHAAKKEVADEQSQLVAKAKDSVRDEIDLRIRRAEEQQRKDLDVALKQFATLDEKQRAVAREELLKLAQEKGIKGAEGMSTEELLAALGAAGVGLAGLLRTFGRSRSAAQVDQLASTQEGHADKIDQTSTGVDQLWDEVKKIEKQVAVVEQKAEGCDYTTMAADLAAVSRTTADHERRLGVIENKNRV